jgi:hypothetical protein
MTRVARSGIHKIAFCWMQVLAGEITDLVERFDQ